MEYRRGRFSWLLRPFLIFYDLFIINAFAYYFFDFNDSDLYFFSYELLNNKHLLYLIYSVITWLISTYLIKFYKVYRYTSLLNIIYLIIKQFFAYIIVIYAFIGIFRSLEIEAFSVFRYLIMCFLCISVVKLVSYYVLKSFRAYLKGNVRHVIIIGKGENAQKLHKMFTTKKNLGYILEGYFYDAKTQDGSVADSFKFLDAHPNTIDEIYCSIDELTESQINKFVKYANINNCNIKFIPNTKQLLTKRLKADYYGYLPVLSIQKVSLNDEFNKFLKRSFDVIFSLLIIIFVLSWLTILLFILIKLESKGSLFFKHKRNGINYKEFNCYKFRSLRQKKEEGEGYVKKNDKRVTRIGKFIRKTSIDELPQFYNVLKGDMSVVGPRPHMLSYTDVYSKKVDIYNFIFRHNVKPGVTGLAQVSGFRGQIESDEDIIGRIKFDNYYIENWSLLLDIKIIFQTLANIIKGEDKAY